MIFDSHCHLNLAAFDKDREDLIKQLEKADVFVINVGTCYATSLKAIEIAQNCSHCWASVGIHPSHTFSAFNPDKKEISGDKIEAEQWGEQWEQLVQCPKVVAIGECGLDYSYLKNFSSAEQDFYKQQQEKVFRQQIKAAQQFHLPLILHIRGLYQKALDILREEHYKGTGVFHFFTGTPEEAKQIIRAGFYIGFSGVITYSSQLDKTIQEVPLNRILIETDAPYVAPVPYRGQRNNPFYVTEIAAKIAQVRNKTTEDILELTACNTRQLFSLDYP